MNRTMSHSILIITTAVCLVSCGEDSSKDNAETEKLQPVEVFVQAVGLDVRRVAFNADGSRILTTGGKGTTLWDARARKELKTVFANEAYSMAASRSGRFLITFNPADPGKIHICDFSKATVRSLGVIPADRLSDGSWIAGISIADDEKHFVLETGQTIKVYDSETLEQVHEIPLKESHYLFDYRKQGLSFLPGTNELLSISYDIGVSQPDVTEPDRVCKFSVNVYAIDATEPKFDFALTSTFIYSWAVSADGRTLALLFMDKRVQTVDLSNGTRKDFTLAGDEEIEAIGFENTHSLVLAGRSGVIGRLDLSTGQTNILTTTVRDHFLAVSCNDLAVSDDGRTVAFCSGYQTLVLYDVPANEITALGDPAEEILGVYYDAGGSFNVITPKSVNTQYGSNSVARAVNAQELHSVFSDQVRIHDPRTGGTEVFDAGIVRTITSVRADGNRLYAWFSRDGKLEFFWKKTPEGEEPDRNLYVAVREEPNRPPVRLEQSESYGGTIRVFDENRKALIAGFASDYLGIWDLRTGRLLDTLTEQSGNAEAFEFIGPQQCLIGTRGNVKLYDLTNNSVVKKFTPTGYYGDNRDIEKIACSPNKNIFATGDAWGLVTIWDRTKEHEVMSFRAHKDWITSLAFSPDGNYIISGSHNGKGAVINDVATGNQLAQFVSFADGEWILITPEGYFNASAGGARHLNVRMGSNVYSIDNFYEKFFNPSYVASVLGGKKAEMVADIRKGFSLPPQVKITSPGPGTEFKSDVITLVVSAKDLGGGIDEIRLYQNGKMVSDDQRGMKILGATSGSTVASTKSTTTSTAGISYDVTKTYEVTLLPGPNNFRAIAFNRE
ncbi:MAG TPA: Ig-like domain-containing protein, partial [Bacteroidota bacterium]